MLDLLYKALLTSNFEPSALYVTRDHTSQRCHISQKRNNDNNWLISSQIPNMVIKNSFVVGFLSSFLFFYYFCFLICNYSSLYSHVDQSHDSEHGMCDLLLCNKRWLSTFFHLWSVFSLTGSWLSDSTTLLLTLLTTCWFCVKISGTLDVLTLQWIGNVFRLSLCLVCWDTAPHHPEGLTG